MKIPAPVKILYRKALLASTSAPGSFVAYRAGLSLINN